MRNDLQVDQRLERGAGPHGEAADGETTFTRSRHLRGFAGKYRSGRGNADDGIVGCENARVAGHYDVESCGAGHGRGVVAIVKGFSMIEGKDAGFGGEGVRAAGTGTVGEGGAPGGWAEIGRRWKGMVSGDVRDESIGGAEEPSESAGVVLMGKVGLHNLLRAVVDLLLNL